MNKEYPTRINDCCGETIVFKLADDLYFEFSAECGEIFHWKECGKPRRADYDQMNKLVKEWLEFMDGAKDWLKTIDKTNALGLKSDEYEYLRDNGRCSACGHLKALHNSHCCTFCMMPGCKCEFGELK